MAATQLQPEVVQGVPQSGTATSDRALLWELVVLVRPHQWVKNLLVVALPLLYPAVWTLPRLTALGYAVAAFVLASAVVYIGNDLADRERDRRHPQKRHRPLAAGRVPVPLAVIFGLVLLAGLAVLVATTQPALAWPTAGYLALNLAYSCGLKHVPVLDLFLVATGFNLRIVAGYLAAGLPLRGWLIPCAFLLSLLLVLGKRRRELELPDLLHRPALDGYSPRFVDQLLVLSAGMALITFLFFLDNELGQQADLAAPVLLPLALLGLYRYLQAVAVSGAGADPVRAVLRDWVLLTIGLLCAAVLLAMRFAATDADLPALGLLPDLEFRPGSGVGREGMS
jgi:4-hydroxybenzoate polyprenyltransferase